MEYENKISEIAKHFNNSGKMMAYTYGEYMPDLNGFSIEPCSQIDSHLAFNVKSTDLRESIDDVLKLSEHPENILVHQIVSKQKQENIIYDIFDLTRVQDIFIDYEAGSSFDDFNCKYLITLTLETTHRQYLIYYDSIVVMDKIIEILKNMGRYDILLKIL